MNLAIITRSMEGQSGHNTGSGQGDVGGGCRSCSGPGAGRRRPEPIASMAMDRLRLTQNSSLKRAFICSEEFNP